MTKLKALIATIILAVLPLFDLAPHAAAQTVSSPLAGPELSSPPPPRYVGHRIEIHPRPLLYRRCVDWYELQHRPSGTVLFPQMHCWWVRG
ncbi:MAG TPA: hypothetical protein VE396_12630 [Xanthobacteraceae bacterium]|jgi:hypothetical protein|nr:hypothetical protein [Xanthobacteraceae bacterium]